MTNQHGDFIWYELMTTDLAASAAFYGPLLGWTFPPAKSEPDDYLEIQTGDEFVGGVLRLTPDMISCGCQPSWIGYIAVDDVDASVAGIEADGGKTLMPARDMRGVGRFAMVADPQGLAFYVMKGVVEGGVSTAFAEFSPREGHCAWNELVTTDQSAAMAFYTGAFGWKKDGEMDMGPMGSYEFLRARKEGGGMIGAVMTVIKEKPVPGWTYYFRVANLDAAIAAVGENGGQIVYGPQEIPGGDFVVNGLDPQGAMFALIGAK